MQINSEFKFNLNQKILPGLVSTGVFNKISSFLVTAITGGKVLVTNVLHATTNSGSNENNNILNVNQQILSLTTGKFNQMASDRDLVFVGTSSNLLVYDVENNTDVFYKDISDGASCCCVGKLGDNHNKKDNVVVVGGNCSLAAFDYKGEEILWSVTGDNVSSLAMLDVEAKGIMNLIVGSEDYELRIFRDDDIIHEITETAVVTHLCPINDRFFGYGLDNGTVGVYERFNRSWRIKSKSKPKSMIGYDINEDGILELITGWSNGKVDVRRIETGEVICKDQFDHSIAGVVTVQMNNFKNNSLLLLVCSVEGEVRIYKPMDMSSDGANIKNTQDLLMNLSQNKQDLLNDMKAFSNLEVRSQNPQEDELTIIPPSTDINFSMSISKNEENPGVEMKFSTNNDTLVKSVLIFAEGIFNGECHVVHPPTNKLSSTLTFIIFPPKDISVVMHIKVIVGYKNKTQYHVFEMIQNLPRFAMYRYIDNSSPFQKPQGFVTFEFQERLQRFALWLNQNFLMEKELEIQSKQTELIVRFIGLRRKLPLEICVNSTNNRIIIGVENLELASLIVQSLFEYLNVTELGSSCNFPQEFEVLNEIVSKIDGIQINRQRMTTDLADNSNLIKNIIVRAEDCRLMDDMNGVKKYYGDLLNLNKDIIDKFKIRSNNHQELLSLLKFVNQFIQRGGNLRAGKYRTQLVAQCRQAIKDNQLYLLTKLIKSGVE